MSWERETRLDCTFKEIYQKTCCHILTLTFSFSIIGNISQNKIFFKVFIHFVFFSLNKVIVHLVDSCY